jgi:hypothetical protein
VKITLTEFGGMAPKIEPRRLNDKLATLAHNVGFESGTVGPATIGTLPSTDFTGLTASVRSVLRPANSDTRLAFTTDTTGEAFASLVAPSDKWGRIYYTTALGPRFTVADNYVADGLKINPVSYRLGIPSPQFAITVGTPSYTKTAGEAADLVRVAYICTFVDKYGHEGAPSPVSTIAELPFGVAFRCRLTFVAESLPDTNVSGAVRRIYRASYDGSTSVFQFIADVPLANASWDDTVPLGDEGESLVSANWVPPPVLKQMVPVASNFVAGFHDNVVCYSESRLPHAWPEEYRYPLKYQIVGMKPTQNGLLVATTGKPYWAFGADPASAVPVELDSNHPCLSATSLVDMGGYVIFASTDGLIAVSGQDVQVISAEYIDRLTWLRDFAPASIVAFAYEGRYVFSVGTTWWVFDPAEGVGFSTLGELAVSPDQLRQAYYDAKRDVTVLLNKSGVAFDVVSMQGQQFVWRSKTFETPPVSFARARVLSTDYPVTLQVVSDGVANQYQVPNERPVALRGGRSATRWALQVEAQGRVTDVTLAQSAQEFL